MGKTKGRKHRWFKKSQKKKKEWFAFLERVEKQTTDHAEKHIQTADQPQANKGRK